MADPDSLNVIVTDLYEEKGMVESIGRLMTERFLSQGKTVAVLGIQSEFAGPIYDIGESDQTINYGVDENRSFVEYKPHPFYPAAHRRGERGQRLRPGASGEV